MRALALPPPAAGASPGSGGPRATLNGGVRQRGYASRCASVPGAVVLPFNEEQRSDMSENHAREAEMLWRASMGALLLVDDDRRCVCVNDGAASLLGAPAEEVLTRRVEDFTPRENWPRLSALWSELHRIGRLRGQCEVLQGDGSRVMAEYRAIARFREGRHLIAAREVAPPWPRARPACPPAREMGPGLTFRESEILQLAADGHSGPEIADLLGVSRSTIKTHLERVYHKLGVRDRSSAVAAALRRGIIR